MMMLNTNEDTDDKDVNGGLASVAHACHPRYLGGRDKEDQGSKPAQANISQDCISKKPITKNGW
jgi:hypothetical protein